MDKNNGVLREKTMSDLHSEILILLCKGWDQGNSNTDTVTKRLLEADPGRDYNETKANVVQTLRELQESGAIQIMTMNWELGEEFFYVCTNRID